jgi:hypothetical protein
MRGELEDCPRGQSHVRGGHSQALDLSAFEGAARIQQGVELDDIDLDSGFFIEAQRLGQIQVFVAGPLVDPDPQRWPLGVSAERKPPGCHGEQDNAGNPNPSSCVKHHPSGRSAFAGSDGIHCRRSYHNWAGDARGAVARAPRKDSWSRHGMDQIPNARRATRVGGRAHRNSRPGAMMPSGKRSRRMLAPAGLGALAIRVSPPPATRTGHQVVPEGFGGVGNEGPQIGECRVVHDGGQAGRTQEEHLVRKSLHQRRKPPRLLRSQDHQATQEEPDEQGFAQQERGVVPPVGLDDSQEKQQQSHPGARCGARPPPPGSPWPSAARSVQRARHRYGGADPWEVRPVPCGTRTRRRRR